MHFFSKWQIKVLFYTEFEVCKNLKHLNWVGFYSRQMAFLEVPTTEVFMAKGMVTIMVSNRLEESSSSLVKKYWCFENEPHFYEPTPHFLKDLWASPEISIEISQRISSNMILVKTFEDGRSQRQKITAQRKSRLYGRQIKVPLLEPFGPIILQTMWTIPSDFMERLAYQS